MELRPVLVTYGKYHPKAQVKAQDKKDFEEYSEKALFHRWCEDSNNEACAIVEFRDGSVETPLASQIRFLDAPDSPQT